ncbi:MAG: dephospho-CoA kinase [bacterium]
MLVVGLTGGIATGKSTVLNVFKELGAKTIDADMIARQIMEPKTDIWKAVVDYFGRRILEKDLSINRKKLADIVFNDQNDLYRLDQMAHPPIIKEIVRNIRSTFEQEKDAIIIVDAPLLFESYIGPLMDKIIVVSVPARTQLQRLMKRDGLDNFQARLRVNAQLPQQEKIKYADYIMNGSEPIEQITEQVKKIWQDFLTENAKTEEAKILKIYFK